MIEWFGFCHLCLFIYCRNSFHRISIIIHFVWFSIILKSRLCAYLNEKKLFDTKWHISTICALMNNNRNIRCVWTLFDRFRFQAPLNDVLFIKIISFCMPHRINCDFKLLILIKILMMKCFIYINFAFNLQLCAG